MKNEDGDLEANVERPRSTPRRPDRPPIRRSPRSDAQLLDNQQQPQQPQGERGQSTGQTPRDAAPPTSSARRGSTRGPSPRVPDNSSSNVEMTRSTPRTAEDETRTKRENEGKGDDNDDNNNDNTNDNNANKASTVDGEVRGQFSSAPSQSAMQSVMTEQTQMLSKPSEPVRIEPLKAMESRRRRLDRLADEKIPEVHVIGEVRSGSRIVQDLSEGAFCLFKVDLGRSVQHLGGDLICQTQVAYCRDDISDSVPFCHPIDVHFALAGLQGWGSPRISIQCFRLDWCGRRILNGYGFVHIPFAPGRHILEVSLWRPVGTMDDELRAYLLGETPALLSQDPLYDRAWIDRCRLQTVASGSILLELNVVTRFFREQGISQHRIL